MANDLTVQGASRHLPTVLLTVQIAGLLTTDKIDWSGKYVFHGDGRVDAQATADNGVAWVDMGMMRLPVLTDEGREELLASKVALSDAMRRPTPDEFKTILTRLRLHFGMQDKSPEEVRSLLNDYWDDLREYPVLLLADVARQWRRNPANKWFPKVGELLTLIMPRAAQLKRMMQRTCQALGEPAPEETKRRATGKNSLQDILNTMTRGEK